MRLIFLLLLSGIGFQSFSQSQSAVSRAGWNRLIEISAGYSKSGYVEQSEISGFPVYTIGNRVLVSVFGKLNTAPDWQYAAAENIIRGSTTGKVATCKVPLEKFFSFDFSRIFSYVELPAKAFPHLERAVKDTRADSVQKGLLLPEAYTGKDVFIGITDWGFDYTHPTFYDTLLSESRVFAAWDQFKNSGTAPANYAYGVEYDTPSELLEAGSDTANIYSYHYHGTHVAGITGGSGAGKPYRGFAFESRFLFATFLIDAASVIDAFNWMKEKADAEGKRLVINMSWGLTYMGTLDGSSLLSQAIAELSGQGVVFVGSAGNNGDVNYHIRKEFSNDSFETRIGFNSYSSAGNNWGQSITMWGEESKAFAAGLRIYDASGALVAQTPAYSTLTQSAYVDSILVIGSDTIRFNLSAEQSNPLNNRPNMRLRVQNRFSGYKVILYSAAAEGTVHYWNVTELTTGVGNWGVAFTSFGSGNASSDAQFSIGEPGCSPDVITVAAYASSYTNAIGNPAGGSLASFSSCGPLYNGNFKPDIAAPGVSVVSSLSSFTDQGPSSIPAANVDFNGKTYKFGSLSGTSMSSPCIAGIVALILDANPSLTPEEVKNVLKSTARTDNYTGQISTPGNVRWGMGKVNAYAAVVSAIGNLSAEELSKEGKMVVYPNPASSKLYVLLPGNEEANTLTLISMSGARIVLNTENGFAETGHLPRGYYIAEVVSEGGIFRTAVVLN